MSAPETLNKIRDSVRVRFEQSKRILTFEEYLEQLFAAPARLLRSAGQYVLDGVQHYGTTDKPHLGKAQKRYRIFDNEAADTPSPVIGQEGPQNQFVQILTGFQRSGRADKLVVLHGPNGSAKSSLMRTLFEGIERYTLTEEGALFSFSWVFPVESLERSGLGFGATREGTATAQVPLDSFAKLDSHKIGAVIRSEMHENPAAFIPHDEREALFAEWLKAARTDSERQKLEDVRDQFLRMQLSHKNSIIFDALLNDYKGDWRKVLRHVRVERYYPSKRLRNSLVTIEPQFNVDAHIRQVTLDRSLSHLPPALQSLNLFQLEGDLVDGNRGIVEYNDFLKRPPEHFKYLLGTCETGSVTLGNVIAFLDVIFVATTNDRQWEAFREHPDFNSFKARMELVRVPYLLRFSDEEKIYLDTARKAAGGTKELMPHTTRALALWAVLTRLKRPMTKNKPSGIVKILEGLTPIAKAKLYDDGTLPENLSDDERRELRGHVEELMAEQQNQPYYEGLMGASARELKVMLQLAAQNDEYPTLGPNAVFAEIRKLIQKPMDYEYLRIEPNQGYHDYEGLLMSVHKEWLDVVDREMMACLNLQRGTQIREFLTRYMLHVTHFVRNEKIRNRVTGQSESPDETLMKEFEENAGLTGDPSELRKNLISRLGAWSLDQPKDRDASKALPYEQIFPDLIRKIQDRFRHEDRSKVQAMGGSILDVSTFESVVAAKDPESLPEGAMLAARAYKGLQEHYGYGPIGAKEALVALVRDRYLD